MKYKILIFLACNVSLGEACQYQCNVHCINQTCDRTDGSCMYGCEDGHQCVDGMSPIWMNFRTIFFLNNVYDVEFFVISFLDTTTIRLSLSENLPAIVGGTVGACVPVIIGIVLVLFVIRYVQINKSYNDSISLILQLI